MRCCAASSRVWSSGTKLVLSDIREQPRAALARGQKLEIFGAIAPTLDGALAL